MLANINQSFHIPARTGKGFAVGRGDYVRIIDLQGGQPVDFWAFNRLDVSEYLSCHHTKPSIEKLFPQAGDAAYTNKRRPIVTLVEDNSPGQHDMQFAACDKYRYMELGGEADHANCDDNLHAALAELGVGLAFSPQPWNMFTNFFLNPDGTFTIKAPATQPGDNLILHVEMDAYLCVSACPQDMNLTCSGNPTDLQVDIGH